MAYDLEHRLVIGVSSRALFDLSVENELFETQGVEAYCRYQVEHEKDYLMGNGFRLIEALLNINKIPGQEGRVEVIIMSHNSPDTSLRVFNSIAHYGLQISRAVLASGASLAPYLNAFHTDLYLSADEADVQAAIDSGIAAGIICCDRIQTVGENPEPLSQIRIAFDGDAVLFSDESEQLYKEQGLEAFEENERLRANQPMNQGPFAKFLKTISDIQKDFPQDQAPSRTALVTARSAPAHERVIRTLRAWNVRIDEAFFLGGISKSDVLKAFGAQIFFDDQAVHTKLASQVVPSARVPYKKKAAQNKDP